MSYSFINQQTATAQITQLGSDKTYSIKGVNGEQTNADNFSTAINGLFDIVGITPAPEVTQRTIIQKLELE